MRIILVLAGYLLLKMCLWGVVAVAAPFSSNKMESELISDLIISLPAIELAWMYAKGDRVWINFLLINISIVISEFVSFLIYSGHYIQTNTSDAFKGEAQGWMLVFNFIPITIISLVLFNSMYFLRKAWIK